MTKLYHAHSELDDFHGCDEVTICWLVDHRDEPVASYEELIAGYKELDRTGRIYTEGALDELFTVEEVDELREYLLRVYSLELHAKEAALPLPGICMGLGFIPVGGGQHLLTLWQEDGYDLSVPIAGYFDVRQCPPSRRSRILAGLQFARPLLEKLAVTASDDDLYGAVAAVWDKTRLYPIRDNPKWLILQQEVGGDEQEYPLDEGELPF